MVLDTRHGDAVVAWTVGSNQSSSVRAWGVDDGEDRWSLLLDEGERVGQIVPTDGVVVALLDGSSDQTFLGIDPLDGEIVWQHAIAGSTTGAILVDAGLVHADSNAGEIVALDPVTGEPRWAQNVGSVSPGLPVPLNGQVVIGTLGAVQAFDVSSGQPTWSTEVEGQLDSVVPLGQSVGAITFGAGSPPAMSLLAFDPTSGRRSWSLTSSNITASVQSAGSSEVVVVTAPDPATGDTVLMVDSTTGDRLWSAAPAGSKLGPVSVIPSGDVLVIGADAVGDELGESTAVLLKRTDGAVVWEAPLASSVLVAPVVAGSLIVLPGSDDGGTTGAVVALESTSGVQAWRIDTPFPPLFSPTLSGDSVLIGTARRPDLERRGAGDA